MKIKVLGCHGGELPRHRTTCFLIDRKLTIDGGAITAALELDDILAIDDIFLTHSHFDHVKDVPRQKDKIHPNEAGGAMWAAAFWEWLVAHRDPTKGPWVLKLE